jgi:hypothetical protein
MNQYSTLLNYLQNLAYQDPLVNMVTQGEFQDMDLLKAGLFPLVHISIATGSFTNTQTINFDVQVGVFNIRTINKEINTDKFWKNDNAVDNVNECIEVLNRMWGKMYVDFDEHNITASENPTFEILYENRSNILDGVILTFVVEMPNNIISLCVEDDE